MSLFSFGDIRFGSSRTTGVGAADRLLNDKTKSYNILKYPLDLGSSGTGHYIVFHVNEQRKTQFQSRAVNNGDLPTVYQNRINTQQVTLGSSATKIVGSIDDLTNGALTQLKNTLTNYSFLNELNPAAFSVGFARTISRTTDTIAMYMPDTLAFVYDQQFGEPSLNGGMAAILSAGASAVDAMKNNPNSAAGASKDIVKNLSPFVLSYLASQNDLTRVGFAAITGLVQNPMIEMLYTSPAFRKFRFDFMFYPRDEKEAVEVQNILERLRFHQAPEIERSSNGFFLIPPSEFDIKFYYNGKENPNIAPVSTSVLESIDIDYAPNGFAAYEVPGANSPAMGKTGMPVAIRLGLSFKETEYLTKSNFRQV
jgi:hypothetical protein